MRGLEVCILTGLGLFAFVLPGEPRKGEKFCSVSYFHCHPPLQSGAGRQSGCRLLSGLSGQTCQGWLSSWQKVLGAQLWQISPSCTRTATSPSACGAAALPVSSNRTEGNFSLGRASEATQAAALATLCKGKG